MLDALLPPGTRRRLWYNRFFRAINILHENGWRSLWLEIKQLFKQLFISYDKVDEPIPEESKEDRTRLMMVLPAMEMGGAERCAAVLLENMNRAAIKPELVEIFDRKPFYTTPSDVKTYVLERLMPHTPPAAAFRSSLSSSIIRKRHFLA